MVTAGGTVFCGTHGETQAGVFEGDTCNFPPDEVFCGGLNSDPSCPPPSPQELNDILNGVLVAIRLQGPVAISKMARQEEVHLRQHFQVEHSAQSQMVLFDLFLPIRTPCLISTAEGSLSTESICNDGTDNDHDGLVDMKDPNCTVSELSEQGQAIPSSNASDHLWCQLTRSSKT